MRRHVSIVAVTGALALSGCAGAMGHMPPVGGIYAGARGVNPNTRVESSDGARPGPKRGEACAMGVLGVASWGDMSLETAKKNAGITYVATLDYRTMDILGIIFQKHCTIITGSDEGPAGGEEPAAEEAADEWSEPAGEEEAAAEEGAEGEAEAEGEASE